MKLRRTKDGANFIVPIFWATLYIKQCHSLPQLATSRNGGRLWLNIAHPDDDDDDDVELLMAPSLTSTLKTAQRISKSIALEFLNISHRIPIHGKHDYGVQTHYNAPLEYHFSINR